MNRSLLVATSVLALAVVSKPLFAAEAETPAPTPSERAAPAAGPSERAAPAAERAPARQRQAARQTGGQQQQSTSSQTSSYTGLQAGGFGGGNAGGGGFADHGCIQGPVPGTSFAQVSSSPAPQSSQSSISGQFRQATNSGSNNQVLGLVPGCGPPLNQSLTGPTGGTGEITGQYTFPVFGTRFVAGAVIGLGFGKTTASITQPSQYVSNPLAPGQLNAEQITNSVSQSTSESVRFKLGYVVPLYYTSIMPYFTAGYVHSTLQGTYNYSASNFDPMTCAAFNPACATNAFSATSWSRSSSGFVWGFGAEMPLSAFLSGVGPGVILVADYTRYQFGSFDVNLPLAIANVPGGGACVQSAALNCALVDVAHVSNVVSNRFTFGARVKLF
jgi:hypothetical protein